MRERAVREASLGKCSLSQSFWVLSNQRTRLPDVLAPDMHKAGLAMVCGCSPQALYFLLPSVRSQMNARPSSVVLGLLLTSLFPALAAADDMAAYFEFATDSSAGAPTPFLDTIGHQNAVWFLLPDAAVEVGEYVLPPDSSVMVTRVYSNFPHVVFTGTDASLFNEEMAQYLNLTGLGPHREVEIIFERGGFASFYVHAVPEVSNPYIETYFNPPVPNLPLDGDGFYIPTGFLTTTNRATVFDPRDGMSNVFDTVGNRVAAFGPFVESIVDVPEGEVCELGGTQMANGIDVDADSTVDVIYETWDVVCNLPPCSVSGNGDGTYTISCVDGGEVTIRDGVDGTDGVDGSDCSATDNGDGTYTIACDDGSEVTVSDGASGSDGSGCTTTENADGTWTLTCGDNAPITLHDGTSGGACTVSGIAEGEYTISCPDGTTVTLRDGDDGDDGGCASAPVGSPKGYWFGALLIGMALLIRRRS